MPDLHIDGQSIRVAAGTTILEAARRVGIDIPTLCWLGGAPALGSCMVCAVKVAGQARYLPACSARAEEGQQLESETPEVARMRRRALEYLLSDHLGECVAMCQRACPAGMDIPRLMAHAAMQRWAEAAAVVRERLPLAGILGRVCHAPCETVCRRSTHDAPVAIRDLERIAASHVPAPMPIAPRHAEQVVVIGAGAAGLSAAWHLARLGYPCTIHEAASRAAPRLYDEFPELPAGLIESEVHAIEQAGVTIHLHSRLTDLPNADAIILATGADSDTHDAVNCFAAGRLLAPDAQLVRRVASGHAVAMAAHGYLRGQAVPEPMGFRSVLRRLASNETPEFVKGYNPGARCAELEDDESAGSEAARCGQCACSVAESCQLRALSARYGAHQRHIHSGAPLYERRTTIPHLYFEPGKCILCGQCVNLARRAGEPFDLGMQNRGMQTTIASASAPDPSRATAAACARICPTGALSLTDELT